MIDAAFYDELVAGFSDWTREDRRIEAPSVAAFLYREARLLDEGRYEDWLALFSEECAYWVPGSPRAGDPRRELAIAFDDRRQLEGRIYRLRTGHAWSQVPASRTSRLISNIEAFHGGAEGVVMVRSTFLTAEHRAGATRLLAGWNAHRLRARGDAWRILAKQVNLLECDQSLRNPSLIF